MLPSRQELRELSHIQPGTSASKTNNHESRGYGSPSPLSTSLPPLHLVRADRGGPASITVHPEPHRRTAPAKTRQLCHQPGPTPSDHRTSVTSAGGLPRAPPVSSLSHIPTSSPAVSSPRQRLSQSPAVSKWPPRSLHTACFTCRLFRTNHRTFFRAVHCDDFMTNFASFSDDHRSSSYDEDL